MRLTAIELERIRNADILRELLSSSGLCRESDPEMELSELPLFTAKFFKCKWSYSNGRRIPMNSRCPKGFLRRKGLKVSTNISSSKIFVFFNIQSLINNCSFRQQNLRESKTKCWHETDRQTREVFRGEMSRDGVFNKATDPEQPAFSLSAAIASVIHLSAIARSYMTTACRTPSLISLVHDT